MQITLTVIHHFFILVVALTHKLSLLYLILPTVIIFPVAILPAGECLPFAPSAAPSVQPSLAPTAQPTVFTSEQPSVLPTEKPTSVPSHQPTSEPSQQPTSEPTERPTRRHSPQPTPDATAQSADAPTAEPTDEITARPTRIHRPQQTSEPTLQPTLEFTVQPTSEVTAQQTSRPTNYSALPIGQQTSQPSLPSDHSSRTGADSTLLTPAPTTKATNPPDNTTLSSTGSSKKSEFAGIVGLSRDTAVITFSIIGAFGLLLCCCCFAWCLIFLKSQRRRKGTDRFL